VSIQVLVIIPVYGASELLNLNLRQLDRNSDERSHLDVYLVDNTENEFEKAKIRRMSEIKYRNITCNYIDMNGNKGFASACNAGLLGLKPKHKYVLLLNTDAIVISNIFERLSKSESDITGVVTNRAGNIQDIQIPFAVDELDLMSGSEKELKKLEDFALGRQRVFSNEVLDVKFVTFFCVAIKPSAIHEIGKLDERFWPGGYEDDDYCIRAKAAGLNISLDRSLFVFHFGSASFAQNSIEKRMSWNAENKARLEEKHAIKWLPHDLEITESARKDAIVLSKNLKNENSSFFVENKIVNPFLHNQNITMDASSYLEKLINIFIEFKDNLRILKVINPEILILSSKYPRESDLNDGYYIRVIQIENMLEDNRVKRIYINGSNRKRDLQMISETGYEISFSNRYNQNIFMIVSLLRTKMVYSHSILRLQNLRMLQFVKWFKIDLILDMHGVVPEESRLQRGYLHAQRLESVEKYAFQIAKKVIVVNKVMMEHFQLKYSSKQSQYLVIPIVRDKIPAIFTEGERRYDFAYIGGTQVWQDIPGLLDIVLKSGSSKTWLFIVPRVDSFIAEYGPFDENIHIVSLQGERALAMLKQSHFGLVVRKDSIVNSVSSPTKIFDYVISGCIPLIGNGSIGGISEFKLNHFKLEEVLNSKDMTKEVLWSLAEDNYAKILNGIKVTREELNNLAFQIRSKN
jgi:GT2 family glycosyltransferase